MLVIFWKEYPPSRYVRTEFAEHLEISCNKKKRTFNQEIAKDKITLFEDKAYTFDLSGLYSNLVIGCPISISISLTTVTWLPGDTINYNITYDKFITNISINTFLTINQLVSRWFNQLKMIRHCSNPQFQ